MHKHKTIPLEHVKSGEYIGKICYECHLILTPSTQVSVPTKPGTLLPNKAHTARVDAAHKLGFKVRDESQKVS